MTYIIFLVDKIKYCEDINSYHIINKCSTLAMKTYMRVCVS